MTEQTNKHTDEISLKIGNVRENEVTRGYCADFTINGRKYHADVSRVMFRGPECMIFKYDEKDHIDWSGVYVNRDVGVNEESLLRCIRDFAEQY